MAKKRSILSNDTISSSPFSFLSLFGFHHVNTCENDDKSFYCSFMRIFQLIISFIILAVIIYLVYIFVLYPLINNKYNKKG